jgi:hypothetical protein
MTGGKARHLRRCLSTCGHEVVGPVPAVVEFASLLL